MANFMLVLALLALCFRIHSCESTNRTDDVAMRIVGGYYTKPGSLPYQASLKYKEEEEHICGAVIVSKTCALTAAHCFDDDDTIHENRHSYTVVAGEHDLWKESRDEQPRKPDAIILHEQYNNPQRANDLAVIKFKKPLVFNDKVNAIKLATPRDKIANKRAIVSGWGVTSFYKDSPSRRLQHVEQMIWKVKDCAKKYGDQFHPGMMCAGWDEGGKDACKGDSGGPLIVGTQKNMTLVGIVSWGINCGTTNPGIYTEVAHYLGWIKAKCNM